MGAGELENRMRWDKEIWSCSTEKQEEKQALLELLFIFNIYVLDILDENIWLKKKSKGCMQNKQSLNKLGSVKVINAETDALTLSQTGCWLDKSVMCGCGENPALAVSK